MYFLGHLLRRHSALIFLCLLGFLALILVVPLVLRFSVQRLMFTSASDVPQTEVAVVLGASVVHGVPSPVLAERADVAIALYEQKKVAKILVTGDNGALSHDEVTPVRKYLLDAGIPAQDIFLDHAGFDTYSSMYRARNVFGARSITIATQDFHLPRSLFIARSLGLTAYGVEAEGGDHTAYEYVREIPASLKALLDIITRRVPKYVGDPIPLSGDGQATWY